MTGTGHSKRNSNVACGAKLGRTYAFVALDYVSALSYLNIQLLLHYDFGIGCGVYVYNILLTIFVSYI
jgi:hypothetical protein